MMRFRITAPLALGLAVTLGACEQPAQETGDMDVDVDTLSAASAEAQLDSLRLNYEAAWNARDMATVSQMMTSDYQEIGPDGVLDYDQVTAMMRDTANMAPEGSRLSIDMEELQVAESGDIAYGSGTSTVTMTAPDGEETSETMRWVAGFERVDGEWKVDRLAFAPDVEAAQAMDVDADADTTGAM